MENSILFIVPYPYNTAPSQRLKFEQYYTAFKQNGYDVLQVSFMDKNLWSIVYKPGYLFLKAWYTFIGYLKRYFLLFNINKYDTVYVHLWGTPFGLPLYEWLLCKYAKRVVYDIDDLIYQASTSPNNKFLKIFKSGSKANFLIKHANHVLVSTDKLFEYAKNSSFNISLIPATIDVNKYTSNLDSKTDKVVIGWSGSHTTSKYLHLLDSVFKKLSTKYNIEIMVMGDKKFAIEGLNIKLVEWTAEIEIKTLQQFDIGVHPIPDEEWVYGKSGGKLVQYMAAGIPIVASAIGPNFKSIKDGYNGFLVNAEEEWIEKLEILINNETLRKQMGDNAKKLAIEQYSVEANLNKYLAVLNG